MISIIIPLYNSEEYIAPCLESVLKQSYDDYEVLVIDDGSKDASADIVAEYSKSNSKIKLFSQSNSGVSAARRKGVECAQGEWVMFLDSDDFLLPNALQTLVDNANDVDVINASFLCTNGQSWIHERLGDMTNDEYINSIIESTTYAVPYARLFRREYISLDDFNFSSDIKVGEDVLMNLKIAKKVRIIRNIPNLVYCYRKNETSAMSSYSRSVLYFIKYFKLRDTILTEEQRILSVPFDIDMLFKAFFDDNIPYKRVYLVNLRNYFLDVLSKGIINNNIARKRIESFINYSRFMVAKKLVYYYKKLLIDFKARNKRRIIID